MSKASTRKKNVYEPEKTYTIVAKFDIKGKEMEAFILKLKRAKLYWIEKTITNRS